MLSDEIKCVPGCKCYTGNETYHHISCPYYSDSMSRLFDEAKQKIESQENLMKEMADVFELILEELEDENYHDIVRLCKDMIKKAEGLK